MRRIKVARNLPKRLANVLAKLRNVGQCMEGNPYFPSPPVPIATFLAHVAEAEAAHVATQGRGLGVTTERNAKLAVPLAELLVLTSYVETVANQTPALGLVIVASAGLDAKDSKGPKRAGFTVKLAQVSGSVRLSTDHPGGDASFEWYASTDGIQYTLAKKTTASKTTVSGLVPLTRYWFRVAVLTKDGPGDPSEPLTLVVE